MVTVLCRAWGQCRAHGPPEEAPLRDPIPEAEMMSAGGGTHVRSKLLCAAWEGRVLGPWTWVASLLLPLFRGLKYPAVSSLFPRPSPESCS